MKLIKNNTWQNKFICKYITYNYTISNYNDNETNICNKSEKIITT